MAVFISLEPNLTQQHVEEGLHFHSQATLLTLALCAALEAVPPGSAPPREVRDAYKELRKTMAVAKSCTGNREPEMAEALEALEFVEDEFRAAFDLR